MSRQGWLSEDGKAYRDRIFSVMTRLATRAAIKLSRPEILGYDRARQVGTVATRTRPLRGDIAPNRHSCVRGKERTCAHDRPATPSVHTLCTRPGYHSALCRALFG